MTDHNNNGEANKEKSGQPSGKQSGRYKFVIGKKDDGEEDKRNIRLPIEDESTNIKGREVIGVAKKRGEQESNFFNTYINDKVKRIYINLKSEGTSPSEFNSRLRNFYSGISIALTGGLNLENTIAKGDGKLTLQEAMFLIGRMGMANTQPFFAPFNKRMIKYLIAVAPLMQPEIASDLHKEYPDVTLENARKLIGSDEFAHFNAYLPRGENEDNNSLIFTSYLKESPTPEGIQLLSEVMRLNGFTGLRMRDERRKALYQSPIEMLIDRLMEKSLDLDNYRSMNLSLQPEDIRNPSSWNRLKFLLYKIMEDGVVDSSEGEIINLVSDNYFSGLLQKGGLKSIFLKKSLYEPSIFESLDGIRVIQDYAIDHLTDYLMKRDKKFKGLFKEYEKSVIKSEKESKHPSLYKNSSCKEEFERRVKLSEDLIDEMGIDTDKLRTLSEMYLIKKLKDSKEAHPDFSSLMKRAAEISVASPEKISPIEYVNHLINLSIRGVFGYISDANRAKKISQMIQTEDGFSHISDANRAKKLTPTGDGFRDLNPLMSFSAITYGINNYRIAKALYELVVK